MAGSMLGIGGATPFAAIPARPGNEPGIGGGGMEPIPGIIGGGAAPWMPGRGRPGIVIPGLAGIR